MFRLSKLVCFILIGLLILQFTVGNVFHLDSKTWKRNKAPEKVEPQNDVDSLGKKLLSESVGIFKEGPGAYLLTFVEDYTPERNISREEEDNQMEDNASPDSEEDRKLDNSEEKMGESSVRSGKEINKKSQLKEEESHERLESRRRELMNIEKELKMAGVHQEPNGSSVQREDEERHVSGVRPRGRPDKLSGSPESSEKTKSIRISPNSEESPRENPGILKKKTEIDKEDHEQPRAKEDHEQPRAKPIVGGQAGRSWDSMEVKSRGDVDKVYSSSIPIVNSKAKESQLREKVLRGKPGGSYRKKMVGHLSRSEEEVQENGGMDKSARGKPRGEHRDREQGEVQDKRSDVNAIGEKVIKNSITQPHPKSRGSPQDDFRKMEFLRKKMIPSLTLPGMGSNSKEKEDPKRGGEVFNDNLLPPVWFKRGPNESVRRRREDRQNLQGEDQELALESSSPETTFEENLRVCSDQAEEIVSHVLKATENLRKSLGVCRKYVPKKFFNPPIDNQTQVVIKDIVSCVQETLQEDLGCHQCITLHSDLSSFLSWLLHGDPGISCCAVRPSVHLDKHAFLFNSEGMGGVKCEQPAESNIPTVCSEEKRNTRGTTVDTGGSTALSVRPTSPPPPVKKIEMVKKKKISLVDKILPDLIKLN